MENPNESFSFMLYTTADVDDQIRVTVFQARSTGHPIVNVGNELNFRPNAETAQKLTQLLKPDMLLLPVPRTLVVRQGSHLRIDSQPVPQNLNNAGSWRNIHIQNGGTNGQSSYSVVKIENGAEMCFSVGYEFRLLTYLKYGLLRSLDQAVKFIIPVRIERRNRKKDDRWRDLKIPSQELQKIQKQIEQRLNHKHNLNAKKMQIAQNLCKIASKTNMIEHVLVAIEKHAAKLSKKELPHLIAKKIPFVSTFMGLFCATQRVIDGDFAGAVGEAASGLLADIPGPGTAASVAIDVGLLSKDIMEAVKDEKNHKQLLEDDIAKIKSINAELETEIRSASIESEIFGEGEQLFNESATAYTSDISKIHINSSDVIEGIRIEYKFGVLNPQHGGEGGTKETMTLDLNEKITRVDVSMNGRAVSSIIFYTDLGRHQQFGRVVEDVNSFELSDGDYLGAIKGYDMFKTDNGETTNICPFMAGDRRLLPGIGFIAKF